MENKIRNAMVFVTRHDFAIVCYHLKSNPENWEADVMIRVFEHMEG